MQGEDFFRPDGVENPIRELDFHFLHSTVAGLAHNAEALNQAEAVEDFGFRRGDVGCHPSPRKAL